MQAVLLNNRSIKCWLKFWVASIMFEQELSRLIITLLVSFELFFWRNLSLVLPMKHLMPVIRRQNKIFFSGGGGVSISTDFECMLDRHMQPLAFSKPTTLHMSETVNWAASSPVKLADELPPGAQRYT